MSGSRLSSLSTFNISFVAAIICFLLWSFNVWEAGLIVAGLCLVTPLLLWFLASVISILFVISGNKHENDNRRK